MQRLIRTTRSTISYRSFLSLTPLVLLLAFLATFSASAAGTNTPPAKKLSRTVGLDIIQRTANPDKTTSLVYRWKDMDGKETDRTVVVNDATIIIVNGNVKKFTDLTEEQFKQKSVATVGADNVTAVCLRFGKAPVSKDQLTPTQLAALAALVPPATPASEAALDKRVNGMVETLKLGDPAKETRIRAVLAADLRAVRDAHNAGFPPDKSVHENLLAGLKADLTPDQVEAAKDLLTINKVPVTFRAYHEIVPNLTKEDDEKILTLLKKAREESLDVKNPDEMAPIFKKYKKEIEAYLNAHGHDWATSYKTFVDAQKTSAKKSDAPAEADSK